MCQERSLPSDRLPEEVRISDTTPYLVAATQVACREHGGNHEIDVVVIDKAPNQANRITAIGEANGNSCPAGGRRSRASGTYGNFWVGMERGSCC